MNNKTILNIEPVFPEQYAGWLDIKLSETVMDRLDQYISVANISKKNRLIGNLSRSLTLVDEENWFLQNCLLEIIAKFNHILAIFAISKIIFLSIMYSSLIRV